MNNKIEYKIVENFEEIYEAFKDEENMVAEKEYYEKNFPHISSGEHKHFGAYLNNKLVGTGSIIKYYQKETKKIYHLWGWTHNEHRHKKIWLNLMKIKADYITQNKWCDDNTTNWAAVSHSDNRFKNLGWNYSYDVNNKFKDKIISKKIWWISWKNYKNISLYIINYKLKMMEK